jgi:phage terminase small subunit
MSELNPQQIAFLNLYNNPKSETFGNAMQSALKAGYAQQYAENITNLMPDWLSENMERRKRILNKAERNLEDLLDSADDRVKADITKFAAKTLGKNEGYSERTELTGKDGKDLPTPLLASLDVSNNNGDKENSEPTQED